MPDQQHGEIVGQGLPVERGQPRGGELLAEVLDQGQLESSSRMAAEKESDLCSVIVKQGYMEAMRGATYAIMPSIYEPFGGATEP